MLLAYWLRQEIGRCMFQDREGTLGERQGRERGFGPRHRGSWSYVNEDQVTNHAAELGIE